MEEQRPKPEELLQLEAEVRGGVVWIRIGGEIDALTVPMLKDAIAKVEETSPPHIVLDLRPLKFMDSMGLGALLGASIRAEKEDRRLTVIRGPAAVDDLFRVTGASQLLNVVDDPASVPS